MQKLYIVTRQDLSAQYTTPQTIHAAMEFAAKYPEEHKRWHDNSNYVIVLAVKDERALFNLNKELKGKGFRTCEFIEPDVGYEMTSLAIVPEDGVKEALTGISLAGRHHVPGSRDRERKLMDLVDAMNDCKNSKGQSIMEHGLSVRDHLFDLIEFLRNPEAKPKYQWRFPQWVFRYGNRILCNLMDEFTMERYAIMHDCSKGFCKANDEFGKTHYPNHAKESAELWLSLYPEETKVGELIRRDMDLHTLAPSKTGEYQIDGALETETSS